METIVTNPLLKDPEMKEILDSFLVETREILEHLDLDLVVMETKPDDNELLNQVFRSFHTIKGTSGFLGLDKLTKITHRCEDILNKLRKGEVKVSQQIMDSVLLAYDKIKELVNTIETNLNEDVDTDAAILKLEQTIETMQSSDSDKKEELADNTKPKRKTSTKNSLKKKVLKLLK